MSKSRIGSTLIALITVCVYATSVGAVCNVIPLASAPFRGSIGALDRPFAAPGEWVELSADVCGASPGFGEPTTSYFVSVAFTPNRNAPPHVVVMSPLPCANTDVRAKLQSCRQQLPPGAEVDCQTLRASGRFIDVEKPPSRTSNLRFRFPDTDRLVGGADDDVTLAGPARIAVTTLEDELPCRLATQPCSSQSGTVACVDKLFSAGTCIPLRDDSFIHFTALPPVNDYAALCREPAFPVGPCTGEQDAVRMATDVEGNLLIPMSWSGVLLREEQVPVARLVRTTTDLPAFEGFGDAIRVPGLAFLQSYSPEGNRVPPLFEQQRDPTDEDSFTLFGSADAATGVLRILRRSMRGRCESVDRACASDAECPEGDRCRRFLACAGGRYDGLPCNGGAASSSECSQDGGTCAPTRCLECSAGQRIGQACQSPADCPIGAIPGGGVAACAPGTTDCRTDGDCPAGGQCGPSIFDFSTRLEEDIGPVLVTDFVAQALDPVPLDGLISSELANAFVLDEGIEDESLNGDTDSTDTVITLHSRGTGVPQAIGDGVQCTSPTSCRPSIARAVARVDSRGFRFPAASLENGLLAYLEPEALQGSRDQNGNSSLSDLTLRAFLLGGAELSDAAQPLAADSSPVFDDRSLAVSKGRIYFRSPEAATAPRRTELISARPDGSTPSAFSLDPSISADGRFVAFRSLANDIATSPTGPCCSGFQVYVRDRVTDQVVLASVGSTGAPASAHCYAPRISADGRFVAFSTASDNLVPEDSNQASDVFVRDLLTGQTERASVSTNGAQLAAGADSPAISGDGSVVAFVSPASGGQVIQGTRISVFARDRVASTTERIPARLGTPGPEASALSPALSGDGAVVAFEARRDDDVGEVLVYDRRSGEGEIASVVEPGVEVDPSFGTRSSLPALSADGRFVVFQSSYPLVRADRNEVWDIYLRDRTEQRTRRVSVRSDGAEAIANPAFAVPAQSELPEISADGRVIAFKSNALDLAEGVTRPEDPSAPIENVYAHDWRTGITELVSRSNDNVSGDYVSIAGGLSRDGRTIAFQSSATNLVPGDANGFISDIFVRGIDLADAPIHDLNGDGDMDDVVLRVLDTGLGATGGGSPSPAVADLGPAERVSVSNGRAVFLQPELTGDPNDPERLVVAVADGASVMRLGAAAVDVSISSHWIGALVPAAPGGGAPPSLIAQFHPIDAGGWVSTGFSADSILVSGSLGVFTAPAASTGATQPGIPEHSLFVIELGGSNPIVRLGPSTTPATQPAADYVVGGRPGEELIAFRRREASAELDGGLDLLVFDRSSGALLDTRMRARPCLLEACDPRVPYRVGEDTVTFLTFEPDLSADLNQDGDTVDLILQILNVRLALAKNDADAGRHALAATNSGLCTNDADPCVVDKDCRPEGSCFVPPGGCLLDLEVGCNPLEPSSCGTDASFCLPVKDGLASGTCVAVLAPGCATDADCSVDASGGDPAAFCRSIDEDFQRLAGPLTDAGRPRLRGGKALAGSGRCVEDLGIGCDPMSPPGRPGSCRRGAFCERTGPRPRDGTCHREQRSCTDDDDCAGGALCRHELLTTTSSDSDNDELPDPIDNCPMYANILQEDADEDGVGDVCDPSSACEHLPSLPSVRCRLDGFVDAVGNLIDPNPLRTSLVRKSAKLLTRLQAADAARPAKLRSAERKVRALIRRLQSRAAVVLVDAAVRADLIAVAESIRADLEIPMNRSKS